MESNILTPHQIAVLAKIRATKFLTDTFYFTGGTVLAAFYLHHRYSEDLDFFSEREVDPLPISVFLNQIRDELGITEIDFQQSYNRNLFLLHFSDEILKIEFTFFPFSRIERSESRDGITVDSLLDIAVNKLFTIYQRTQARDYIDLYLICKEKGYVISDLIAKAKAKFDWHIDPLQLGTQFVKAPQFKDYPRMIVPLVDREWHDFFLQEARNLKPDILE